MRTWSRLSKLAAVVAVAGSVAVTAASPAAASGNTASDQAAACGGGVFLDGLRALDVAEEGEADEVYIENQKGVKVWPVTTDYVPMTEGMRVEVDKCVPVGTTLRLWDDDGPINPRDFLGSTTIRTESTGDHLFVSGESLYRLGVTA